VQLPAATAARIAESIPEALRPSWLAKTWSGTYGAQHLHASVTEVANVVSLTPRGISGEGSVLGTIPGPADVQAGFLHHGVKLDPRGSLTVTHDAIRLPIQGSGFGRAFNERAFGRYAAAGVDDVTLNAVDVGAYARARQGFELLGTRRDRALQLADLVRTAHAEHRIDAKTFRSLEPRLLASPDAPLQRSTLSSIRELAAMPDTGPAVLLHQDWYGARRIAHPTTWWAPLLPGSPQAATASARHGSELVSRHVGEQLPAALDPFRAPAVFERHLAGAGYRVVRDSPTTTLRLGRRDQLTSAVSSLRLWHHDGSSIDVGVRMLRGRQLRGSDSIDSSNTVAPELRASLDSAWHELGIDPR
jgi:hypothetical protein